MDQNRIQELVKELDLPIQMVRRCLKKFFDELLVQIEQSGLERVDAEISKILMEWELANFRIAQVLQQNKATKMKICIKQVNLHDFIKCSIDCYEVLKKRNACPLPTLIAKLRRCNAVWRGIEMQLSAKQKK